ncbi:MAG: tRNA lysidine(34) synthetase TilS, partial [Chloroflexota bacterium]
MLAEVNGFIAGHRLIGHGEKVLLAVSGGIDSMAMAHMFLHLPYDTGIAHCNFSLRGNDSDLDEELVRKFSENNNIPFYTVRFNTQAYADEKGISIQMAARELRYDWFEDIRRENNFDLIAVAHNLNDNVETMLINLVRGT